MRQIQWVFIAILFPVAVFAANNPSKLYTETYDGLINDEIVGKVSFFRKGTQVVALDWETKKETTYQCNLSLSKFELTKLSYQDEIYLLTTYTDDSKQEGWILDRSGSCFRISELVKDFTEAGNIWWKVYYSNKIKQIVIPSSDYHIAPTDGQINIFIDPKTKSVIKKIPGNFHVGPRPFQDENTAFKVSGISSFDLNLYNTDMFKLEKTIDLGDTYISKFYFEESRKLNLSDTYLISGANKGNQTFIGHYNKITNAITKDFNNPCFFVDFHLKYNFVSCHDTPPGRPWTYSIQDLTTGKLSVIWWDLFHFPKVSEKNGLIIANKQNGLFEFYDIQTMKMKQVSGAPADYFFFDKNEQNIITVDYDKWNGVVEISKFPLAGTNEITSLYKLNVGDMRDSPSAYYDADKNKLFIPLGENGAYYLDVQ